MSRYSAARLIIALALAGAVTVTAAAGTRTSRPILSTRLEEARAVSGGGYLAWAQNSRRHPRLVKVYARLGTGKPVLVSRRFQGYPGGISGTTLVYHEFSVARGESDIRFYDLRRRRHLAVPRGVNTSLWEYVPSLSGDWLLFGRSEGSTDAVVLRNLRTRAELELDRGRAPRDEYYAMPGQVNGKFAVWHRCPRGDRPCVVFRYDITTGAKTALRAPEGFIHYAPSVGADGTVYLVRGEFGCGSQVELWRYPIAGEPKALVGPLAIGRTIWNTYVETRIGTGGPANEVYHDRSDCDYGGSNVWRYTDTSMPGG